MSKRRTLRISDQAEQGFVDVEASTALRQLIDQAVRSAGLEPQVVMKLCSIPSILRMVATTGHLAFGSRLALNDQREVVELRVRNLLIRHQLAVISRRNAQLSGAAEAFAGHLLA